MFSLQPYSYVLLSTGRFVTFESVDTTALPYMIAVKDDGDDFSWEGKDCHFSAFFEFVVRYFEFLFIIARYVDLLKYSCSVT